MIDKLSRIIKKHQQLIIKTIPLLFYALLISFLALYLKSIDIHKLRDASLVWRYILFASFFGLLARFSTIYIWFILLKGLGARNLDKAKGQLIYVYAKSWLGRYIPGTAPWILGKIYFASKHGISKNKLAVSSLLEGALQVSVVMAVAMAMLVFDRRLDVIDIWLKLAMIGVLIICIVCILPPVFNRIITTAYKILKKKEVEKEHLADGKTILKGSALFVIISLVTGVALFYIAKSVDASLAYSNIWFVMGAGNLAGAASMLAIFAPSGLGVKEGIQLLLFSLIMPKELALVVVVVTRLWSVAMDFIFFGLSAVISKIIPEKS